MQPVHVRAVGVRKGRTALAAVFVVVAVLADAAVAADPPRFSAPVEAWTGRAPMRVVAADLNVDGTADIATADYRSRSVSVLLGTGDGDFRRRLAYRTAPEPADVAAADLNGDGRPDLATASADRRGLVTVLLNEGDGRFRRDGSYPTGARAPAIAVADINGDGLTDILTGNLGRRDLVVLPGRGAGRFGAARRVNGGDGAVDIDTGDLNGDDNLDVVLATATWGNAVAVRLGNGDGTFAAKRTYRAGQNPDGVTLADLNHDGRLDLAVTNNWSGDVSVFLGRGDGSFGEPARFRADVLPDAVVVADFDADGHPDLATSAVDGVPAVLTGSGDGTFRKRPAALEWLFAQGAAVADFNRDGRPDLAFTDPYFPAVDVYLNWTGLPAPPCVVLDIRDDPLRRAKRSLRDGGCRLGQVTLRNSRSVAKDRVISVRPRVGSVLPSFAPVDIVLSRGPSR
jgi:hypothetical protein